jgi:regulatory associated protein of mTOR
LTLHLKSNSNFQPSANSNSSTEKIRENIARNLLVQYENWQPRVRYKTLLDPTSDDFRKLCISLRKSARSERVLIHYNGHGVPRPTRNGELWVFNKQFTQYIPVNVADVVSWTGWPAVWILDCPAAAFIAHSLQKVVNSLSAESSSHGSSSHIGAGTIFSLATVDSTNSSGATNNSNTVSETSSDPLKLITFSACDSHETLPFTPSLPADILTSCLTTPLDMAIRWHCYIGGPLLPKSLSIDAALQIPGKISDRRTPLGELNWIFTAITDTIAWLVLPRDLFRRLYRQDLLIASLSRNYLLAQRILKSLYCTASAYPSLPPTHQHNLWTLWDHALDTLLAQMKDPVIISGSGNNSAYGNNSVTTANTASIIPHGYISQSTFFPDQLDAFELWLLQHRNIPPNQISGPPDQLPAALQVLLSQNLRPRALKLFSDFCDFGPWACLECLHVGIHPYILKLIVSNNTAPSSNQVTKSLLHIWTCLMNVDSSCKADILKDSAFAYFVNAFAVEPKLAAKAIVTFSLDNPSGHEALLKNETFIETLKFLTIPLDEEEEIICKLLLLNQFPGISKFDPFQFLFHDSPKIRAAAVLATEISKFTATKADGTIRTTSVINDPSPLVRLELLNRTRDESLRFDPFDAISQRFKEGNFKSNFASNFVNENKTEIPKKRKICKFQVLNQLEIETWLERGNKLETQLAVLESPKTIKRIFFHQSKSLIYFLDSEGTLRRWDWQDDPDITFDELNSVKIGGSDALLIEDFIYSIDPNGAIRIYSLEDEQFRSAFMSGDTNVKILGCKKGNVLIVGDMKISLYDPETQKLLVNPKRCSNS